MDIKQFKALVKFCRANHVSSVKFEGVEFALTAESHLREEKPKTRRLSQIETIQGNAPLEPSWAQYTPDQLATWSSPDLESEAEAN